MLVVPPLAAPAVAGWSPTRGPRQAYKARARRDTHRQLGEPRPRPAPRLGLPVVFSDGRVTARIDLESPQAATLRGRDDWTEHFFVSAALTVLSPRRPATPSAFSRKSSTPARAAASRRRSHVFAPTRHSPSSPPATMPRRGRSKSASPAAFGSTTSSRRPPISRGHSGRGAPIALRRRAALSLLRGGGGAATLELSCLPSPGQASAPLRATASTHRRRRSCVPSPAESAQNMSHAREHHRPYKY